MAATAWHSGSDPGRAPFVKALHLCRRPVPQDSFPLRTQTRQRCGGADWTGWAATSIWPAVHVGPPSDQMENVEVAGQEATLSTTKGTTDCRIDHHSTDL